MSSNLTRGINIKEEQVKTEIFVSTPNLSLVLPGTCQANCDFCFWEHKRSHHKWLERLEHTLDMLPSCFYQVSITGGEPTLSPYLADVLRILGERKDRYTKIVLTTNGARLDKCMERIKPVVDHVNISRHHWGDIENEAIFDTTEVPSTKKMKEYAKQLGNKLTFNCVTNDPSVTWVNAFLHWAGVTVGAKKVCFRQEHGTLEPIQIEDYLLRNAKKTSEGSCPVCRSIYFNYHRMNVGVKYSVIEPTDVVDGIYELILHADGKLTADWDAQIEVELED